MAALEEKTGTSKANRPILKSKAKKTVVDFNIDEVWSINIAFKYI